MLGRLPRLPLFQRVLPAALLQGYGVGRGLVPRLLRSRGRQGGGQAPALLLAACLATACSAGGPAAKPAPATANEPAAGGAAPAAAPALRGVRLAYVSTSTTFAGIWAAKEYGLFEQYGLRADDLLYINGGPALAQALVAGELEAGYLACSPAVTAIASGAPLKVVAGVAHGFVHQLYVRDDSGIYTAADLRGKRVGVSRVGSESHTVVRSWAKSQGVQDGEILYVNAGGAAERLAALNSGSVDLLPLDPPIVIKAEKLGYRRLADLTRENLPWQGDGLTVPERLLQDDPALARNLVAAVVEGAYLVRGDRARAIEILGKYIGEDDPEALEVARQSYVRKFVLGARPDPVDVQAVQEVVEETLPGAAREPYSHFVDTHALDTLDREGYFARLEQKYPLQP